MASVDHGVRLWDIEKEATVRDFNAGDAAPVAIRIDSSGHQIAGGFSDAAARLWSLSGGAPDRVLKNHPMTVFAVGFSADGRRLITGSGDQSAQIWDLATGEPSLRLTGHRGFVIGAVFNPDGQLAATASVDGYARLWDTKTGALLAQLEAGGPVFGCSFDRTSPRLFMSTNAAPIAVWDIEPDRRSPSELAHWVQCHIPFELRGQQLGPSPPVMRKKCSNRAMS